MYISVAHPASAAAAYYDSSGDDRSIKKDLNLWLSAYKLSIIAHWLNCVSCWIINLYYHSVIGFILPL
jgi:hypothetical protein